MPSRMKSILICLSSLISVFLLPLDAFARAGGAGGNINGLSYIIFPFFLIYILIVRHKIKKKNQQSRELLLKLQEHDKIWDIQKLRRRAYEAFYIIQKAWMERDQQIAHEYMTDGLYNKHKVQTDMMIANHEKNILKDIYLKDLRIVDVEDYNDNEKDVFWICMSGSMIDYIIDDRDNHFVRGNKTKSQLFYELWKFIRHDDEWFVDEIIPKTKLLQLRKFIAFSETYTT